MGGAELLHLVEALDAGIRPQVGGDQAATGQAPFGCGEDVQVVEEPGDEPRGEGVAAAGGVDHVDVVRGQHHLILPADGQTHPVPTHGEHRAAHALGVQPRDDRRAVLRADQPAGLLDVGHQVVDVRQRRTDQFLGVRAGAHQEIDGGGAAELLGPLEDAGHRLSVDARQDERPAEMEDLRLGDGVPRDVVLGERRVGADHVERRPGAVRADQQQARGRLQVRVDRQMGGVDAVALHRGADEVADRVVTDPAHRRDVDAELGQVDRGRGRGAGHGELDPIEHGELLARRDRGERPAERVGDVGSEGDDAGHRASSQVWATPVRSAPTVVRWVLATRSRRAGQSRCVGASRTTAAIHLVVHRHQHHKC
ncbi:hypothetical protein SDC9_78218 [bioreactor metagenome]|uniref:Uncharacterized protein n=1 Tax=bioreactor metagenome TaxID=1076179 RepID=A0A644YUY6_9ZZZZ